MKFLTYNILNGGKAGIQLIKAVIAKENPDYVTISEANTFAKSKSKLLKEIASDLKYPYYEVALSGEYNYHVAVLSRLKFKKVLQIKPLMRAGIITIVDSPIGELSIISTHLTPYTEDLRLPEVDLIVKTQKPYQNKILMGDMNSLSRYDGYKEEMIKSFNEMQLKKFTTAGRLRFDAVGKLELNGYNDTALLFKKNKEYTVPTSLNEYQAHSNMRLDYIFVSKSLIENVKDYSVVKNNLTDKASDHYPVVVVLG